MKPRRHLSAALAAAILFHLTPVLAAVPATLNYQGYLSNPTGAPLNAPVGFTFMLYDVASGGTALYTEQHQSVAVNNGTFNVQIGSVTPLILPFDVPYWLEITVQPPPPGQAELLTPRQPLSSTATALRAAVADALPQVPGSGRNNSAMGPSALQSNTTGDYNTAIGTRALVVNTTGSNNTAIGAGALESNTTTTGSYNTAIGNGALSSSTTGGNNIAIGNLAGYRLTTGDFNIYLGNQGVYAESGSIRIGNPGDQSKAFIAGIRGVTPGVNDPLPVVIDSAGQLGTAGTRFSAGNRAKSLNPGCFTWADSNPFDYTCTLDNAFTARATGGVFFTSSIDGYGYGTAGVRLASGSGSWSNYSDRASKTNIVPVDGLTVLKKLVEMQVSSWSYKAQDASIRHIGPMAQDFSAAFGVGTDNKHIDTVDADGVALAAIKGLYQKLLEKDRQMARIQAKNTRIERELVAIKARLGLK